MINHYWPLLATIVAIEYVWIGCLLKVDPAGMRDTKVPPEHRANGESFDLPQARA